MIGKREIEALLDRQKHISYSKEDVYEILNVLSAYESISIGKTVGLSGIISRSRFNLVENFVRSIGDNEVKICFEGGYPEAERGRVIFFKHARHAEVAAKSAGLKAIELKFNSELGHRDILGALLSLGVKRSRIGDIGIEGLLSYVVVSEDMAGFIMTNLNQVGRSPVESSLEISCSELNMPKNRLKKKEIVLSSMRADLVLSKVFNIGRKEVKGDISKDKVKLNDFVLNKANHCVVESDVLSYRGNGKIIIGDIKGMTKKGNYVLKIKKYV